MISLLLFFPFLICFYHLSLIDDKKLGGVLKKINLTDMKGLEEVNIFRDDGSVIHITSPKGQFFRPLLDVSFNCCILFEFRALCRPSVMHNGKYRSNMSVFSSSANDRL